MTDVPHPVPAFDQIAAHYFLPPHNGYWKWAEAGDAAEWSDGTLIAFHEEIESVLRELSPRGLPPFGAVLLLIAACRDSWGSGVQRCAALWEYRNSLDLQILERKLPQRWADTFTHHLATIHNLPADLRTSPQAKAELASQFFDRPTSNEKTAAAILRTFADGFVQRCFARGAPDSELAASVGGSPSVERATNIFVATVSAVILGNGDLSETSFRHRAATGLDSPPEPAPLEESAPPLLEALQNDTDPDLRFLGEIARHLAGAVHISNPPSTPDNLPLGGYSDVSNRGSLERLLVSELALDDLSLSVRIAMNEALYLRRESPPKSPARHRVIFVDTGVRLWGIPRLFATAVALAFSENTDGFGSLQTFAARHGKVGAFPSDLRSRDGLLAHLAALTPSIHPAAPWDALLAYFPGSEHQNEATDFILITHPLAAEDPDFIAAASAFRDRHYHLATVDGDGSYMLWKCGPAGRQKVASAEIDLAEILSAGRAGAQKLRDDSNTDLPTFYRLEETPLRIAYPIASPFFFTGRVAVRPGSGEFVAAPRDGRLLYWDQKEKGARLLSAFEPAGELLWLGVEPYESTPSGSHWVGQIYLHSVGDSNPSAILEITHVTENGQSVSRANAAFDTSQGRPLHIHHGADHIALFWQRQTDVISITDGQLLARREHSHDLLRGCGAYVEFAEEGWFRYAHNTQGIFFEGPVAKAPRIRVSYKPTNYYSGETVGNPPPLAAVWDMEGSADAWALGSDGPPRRVEQISTGSPISDPAFVSADGHRVALVSANNAGAISAFSYQPQDKFVPSPGVTDLVEHLEPTISAANENIPGTRRNFVLIEADPSGTFFLKSPRGTYVCLGSVDGKLHLRNAASAPSVTNPAKFESLHHVPDHLAGLDLKVATWEDGTRAYLDRNAFLHLCPSDASLPEITIVLVSSGPLPHWASDELVGDPHPYFGGSMTSSDVLDQMMGHRPIRIPMNPLSTQLKTGSAKAAPAAVNAWFLPGADPSDWVNRLLVLDVGDSVSLFSVPSALGDPKPAGLFAIPRPAPADKRPYAVPGTLPFTRLGDSELYYPTASHFDPPIHSKDVAASLEAGNTYLFHPSAGLIAFSPSQSLGLHDLLDIRIDRDASATWGNARAGEFPNTILHTITVSLNDPDPEQQLIEAGEDIGDKNLKGLPKPKRPGGKNPIKGIGDVAGSLGTSGLSGLAHVVKWITGLAPPDPNKTKPTLIDKLASWAENTATNISKRNREINRLLDLLEDNPEEGLRYALPIGGSHRDRGLAQPGDTLGRRNTDFSLGNLGGGQPADHWDVPWDIQQKLIASYREAALREIRLGHHRRAAYIYAELLEDLAAAAATLRKGRHFREAAHLYRDRLRDPRLAATCFREGGLFEDAIALYRDLGENLVLGDLLRELGREDEAISSYRAAIDISLEADQPLGASDLILDKLNSSEEALSTLRDAWPHSRQAIDCLKREIEIVSKNDPASARRRLVSLRGDATPPHLVHRLASFLAGTGVKATDPDLSAFAADEARRVAGIALAEKNCPDRGALIAAVAATDRSDRLLAKDTRRYKKATVGEQVLASPFRGKLEDAVVEIGGVTSVGPIHRILKAEPCDTGIFCWGLSSHEPDRCLVFLRHDDKCAEITVPDRIVRGRTPGSIIPNAYPPAARKIDVFAAIAFGTEWPDTAPLTTWGDLTLSAGAPGIDIVEGVIGLCYDEHGAAHSFRRHRGEFFVTSHTLSGESNSSIQLEIVPEIFGAAFAAGLAELVPMIARRDQIILALGDQLVRIHRGQIATKPLPAPAIKLTASPHLSALRIVAALEDGSALLIRGDPYWEAPPIYLPATDAFPLPCFDRGGNLFVAHDRHLLIFDPRRERLARQHLNLFPTPPLALIASPTVAQFRAVTQDGIFHARLSQ